MYEVFGKRNRSRAMIALALALTVVLGACAPTITELSRQQYVAKVRVESTPAGATVLVDDRAGGQTPTTVPLRYTVLEERVTSNDQWAGGLLGIILGGVAGLAGAGLLALVSSASSGTNDGDGMGGGTAALSGIAALYGVALLITGALGMGFGIWAISTASRKRTRTLPDDGLDLALRLPGSAGLTRLRIKGDGTPPPYDRLPVLRFDAPSYSWQAPGLPKALKLEMRTPDNSARLPARPHILPTADPATQPPPPPPTQEEPGLERPTLAP